MWGMGYEGGGGVVGALKLPELNPFSAAWSTYM